MSDEKENPNIEWKKPGVDDSEKMGRRIDAQKAEKFEAKKKTNLSPTANKTTIPIGLNKIRKKIKYIMDDEDEDENDYQLATGSNTFMTLENALTEDEKQVLLKKNERDNIKQQQNAGKMESMLFLNRFVKEAGLKELDQEKMNQQLNDSTLSGKNVLRSTIKEEIVKNANIKWQELSDKELVGFLRGVKKVSKVGGNNAIEGMKVKDVLEAGEIEIKKQSDEERIAKIILRKTGRNKKREEKERKKIKKAVVKNRIKTEMDLELERR